MALGLLAVAVVAVLLVRDGGGRDLRTGSVATGEEPGLFPAPDPPERYRVDYRVEGLGGDDRVVSTDRLWVRRPFESRLESFDGAEVQGEPSSVQVGAFGALRAEGDQDTEVVVAVPPGPPASDTRVAAALAEAHDDGRFELRERREVLGRPCQVIRSATDLASGDLAPPGEENYADTCIDERGLVLEELLVVDGQALLRRVAVDLDLDPDLADVSFAGGEQTVSTEEGGGFLGETEPDSRAPGPFFEPTAPEGFDRLGRFAVIPAQHENFTDITRRDHRLTYVSDVFVDGPSVVVFDQGGTFGDVDPFPDLAGVAVEVDGLGTATLSYGRSGPVLVVPRGHGDFLRARGTTSPAVLLDLLEDLEEVEGGELRLLDDEG